MKKLLCLALALVMCLTALPALAEFTLNPDQWTEHFDYTVEDYCDTADTLLTQMMNIEGEWQESDAPKGYRILTFKGEGVSDIVLLADKRDRVLAIGLSEEMSMLDADTISAKGQAFGMGMAAATFISRLVELDGDNQALVKEVPTIQADLMTFQEALNELQSMLTSAGSGEKSVYKDIEAAGHHMNFVLRVSVSGMTMSFTSVFAPIAEKPE